MAVHKTISKETRPPSVHEGLMLPEPSAEATVRSASPSILRTSPPYTKTKACQIAEVVGAEGGWEGGGGGGGGEIERWSGEEVLEWLKESGFEQYQVRL